MIIADRQEVLTKGSDKLNELRTVREFMELNLIKTSDIPTLTRDEAYKLYNKALYISACAEVFALELLDHYKSFTPKESTSDRDAHTKLISALVKKGLNYDDVIKLLT